MPKWLWSSILLICVVSGKGAQAALPDFRVLKASYVSSEASLLDRHGRRLQEIRVSAQGRSLSWIELEEVSPAFKNALLTVEDKRFFEHGGVDLKAVAGAAWQNLGGGRRGASTITMQLANILEPGLKGKKTLWEKVRQAKIAWDLEKIWQKDEILEAYINLVTFRGEHRGIHSAARSLFNKDPHGLNERESYLLAALLKAPNMNLNQAAHWLCVYAAEKPSLGSCGSLTAFARSTLDSPGVQRRENLAPHLARVLLRKPENLKTSIDAELQKLANDLLAEQVVALESQNAKDGAVIVVHNPTGEVLAYVGSSGKSEAPEVDMVRSRRQAGSTLKPILFATAFEGEYLTPNSWLLDEPFEVAVDGRGGYRPENYDKSFHGPVTVAQALGSSLNIPAVRAVELIGVEPFYHSLEQLGFLELKGAEEYGASLALGSADVTLLELANAYRAFANEGVWSPLRYTPGKNIHGRRVFSRKVAAQISSILSSRENRALTFGWNSLLATSYATAVKTGTSKDMRDNWCIGYSREFTVAVWMGNSSGEPMWQVSGVSGAAPVWRGLMDHLHRNRRSRPFAPEEIAQPTFHRAQFGKILYPMQGAILALDPDIPPGRQFVQVEAEGHGVLKADGKILTDGQWAPELGKHRLSLHVGDKTLDEIQVEVR